jgi:hypothetical protein
MVAPRTLKIVFRTVISCGVGRFSEGNSSAPKER